MWWLDKSHYSRTSETLIDQNVSHMIQNLIFFRTVENYHHVSHNHPCTATFPIQSMSQVTDKNLKRLEAKGGSTAFGTFIQLCIIKSKAKHSSQHLVYRHLQHDTHSRQVHVVVEMRLQAQGPVFTHFMIISAYVCWVLSLLYYQRNVENCSQYSLFFGLVQSQQFELTVIVLCIFML